MAYPQFEDLQVWQKSRELAVGLFGKFGSCKIDALREQIERDAFGIMNNIAKGYERKGAADFGKFLYIARGYCGELKSTLWIAMDLEVVSEEQRVAFYDTITDICKMLAGLIKKVNGRKVESKTKETPEPVQS